MQKFELGVMEPVDSEYIIGMAKHLGVSEETVREAVKARSKEIVWVNDKYQVNITDEHPDYIWLSIKRRDKQCIHDWRDLQEIKNMLVGPENEAIQIYPAESRLVDTANQFHLWVFKDSKYRIPIGFNERKVNYESAMGAVQRPEGERV